MNIGNIQTTLRIQNRLSAVNNVVEENIQKLASGIRINRASDDASGLKISEKMRSQIRGLDMAIHNAMDGISMIQTAEGGLEAITSLLQRMNELIIKVQNGTYTKEDLNNISIEYEQCKTEIDRIAETTTFNGKKLLNINTGETKIENTENRKGTTSSPAINIDKINFSTIGDGNEYIVNYKGDEHKFVFSYNKNTNVDGVVIEITGKETNREKAKKLAEAIEDKIGTVISDVFSIYPEDMKNYSILIFDETVEDGAEITTKMVTNAPIIKTGNNKEDNVYLTLKSVTTEDLDIKNIGIKTRREAENAIKKVQEALEKISNQRATLGATQNRIEYAINRITVEMENTKAAESRISDVDMAEEMVAYAKNKIIKQSAMSMLAQANQEGKRVLELLKQ